MEVIYQLTFFLALALLAILITVFVFAVSLLGRALETAARNERQKITERKENNAKEMAAIKKNIEKAEAEGEIPKGLARKLDDLERKDKNYDKELSRIRRAPELLTVRVGVVHPGICLTLALILSGGAWFYRDIGTAAPITLWLLGLAAIVYSGFRILCSLRVIESVAITSEAEAERRLARAVKAALIEVEEEKRPELLLEFREEQPPVYIKSGAEKTIKFGVSLEKGDVARKPEVDFFAPAGFTFPGKKVNIQPSTKRKIADHITSRVKLEDITRAVRNIAEITIKAPSQKGKFTILYRLHCEWFASEYEEFEVIVE